MARRHWTFVLASLVFSAGPSSAQEQELSFVIEQGFIVPAQSLAGNPFRVRDLEGLSKGRFVLEIQGQARFANTKSAGAPASLSNGVVSLPAIAGGNSVGESFVHLALDGRRVGQPLYVATRPPGTITQITGFVPRGDECYLALGDHYAVIDMALYRSRVSDEGRMVPMKPLNQRSLDQKGSDALCIRTPFPPGWVEWQWVDPWFDGYSVKAEEGNYLVYGVRPSQGCDGIYNLGWGCGAALKIPDHCTFYVGEWSYCCNAAASAIYGVVRWVYPGSGGEATA